MTKPPDDLDATRQVIAILEPFENIDRERILRWAREKLGMLISSSAVGGTALNNPQSLTPPISTVSQGGTPLASDIKSFVENKSPKNDTQLAATVAYYYRFLAPEKERKDSITAKDLLEACRKADRSRPARAAQTMVNTFAAGLFDKAGHGSYKINSVGENLVAMVLPGESKTGSTTSLSRVKKGTRAPASKQKSKKVVKPGKRK